LKKAVLFLFIFFSLSCDKGLSPPSSTSISGTVHFIGTPKDSVKILAVVLVEPPPPYATSSIISGLNTTIFPYTLSTTTFHDTSYSYTVIPDTTYHYLGIAQNFGDLFKDWKVVAFIHDGKDSAVSFMLKPGEQRTGVDISVNFDSLPRQPFIK